MRSPRKVAEVKIQCLRVKPIGCKFSSEKVLFQAIKNSDESV